MLAENYNPGNRFKLWKPKKGKLYIFWNNNDIFYSLNKYKCIIKNKKYKSKNKLIWDNIAPLEFIQTLKIKKNFLE